MMRVLVGCENSQIVTTAFRARGHDAYSCDLLPTDGNPDWHIQDDVLKTIGDSWDLAIFFPTCTYLCSSGLHWNKRVPGREKKTEQAIEFVRQLMDAPIPRIAIENPVGCISTRIRPADQYIQPYDFGDDASKKTGLWLKGLPPLQPTDYIEPRWVSGKPRWANQTDSGQNRLGPSDDRWKERSRTYPGIAHAMAQQWG
jgi:hypothetical protein